jgi:DNA-binding MarR family transcriptional regulator
MTQLRVLRALARFDSATSEDIATALGGSRVRVNRHLRLLVESGLAEKRGENYASYSVTVTGRVAAAAQ